MNKIFPPMLSKPENRLIVALIPFSLWIFILFPMFMPILGFGLWEQWAISVWLEIGYHVFNGVAMLLIICSYLKEDWFMVSTDLSFYLKHVVLTVGLTLGAELILLGTLFICGFNISYMLECLPVVEMFVSHTPLLLIDLEPVFGTIALSVFAPISICALFYCLVFAPVCCKKTWLAYLCVAVITLVPPIVNILWRGEAILVLSGYIVHLPIHLLACWSYQKTNNVWTPLISLMITNLLMSVALPILLFQ